MRTIRVGIVTLLIAWGMLVPIPAAYAMPCGAAAGNPTIDTVAFDFFIMESTHIIACDASTALIHVIGELTRDEVVVATSTADCINKSSCSSVTLGTHTRHQHAHLWHGYTSGWHKHSGDNKKRNVQRVRSPDCTPTTLFRLGTGPGGSSCRELVLKAGGENIVLTTGPSADVVIATGTNWTLKARVERAEIVFELVTSAGSSGARGTLGVGQQPGAGNFITWGGHVISGGPFYVSGLASPEVSQVRVDLNVGGPLVVPTVGGDAGFSVVFYAAEVPFGARPLSIVALDQNGLELETLDASLSLEV